MGKSALAAVGVLIAFALLVSSPDSYAATDYPLIISIPNPSANGVYFDVALSGDGSTTLISGLTSLEIYRKIPGVWGMTQPVVIDEPLGDPCPCYLSMDGSEVLAGSQLYSFSNGDLRLEQDFSNYFAGLSVLSADGQTVLLESNNQDAVYVFHKANGVWPTFPTLTINNPSTNLRIFGQEIAVSADGTVALVGNGGLSTSEYAYVFQIRFDLASSSHVATLSLLTPYTDGPAPMALSGDGSTAAIAGWDGAQTGQVFVYRQLNGSWSSTPVETLSGSAVGIGGDTQIFGADYLALSNDGKTLLIPGASSFGGFDSNLYVYQEGKRPGFAAIATLSDPSPTPSYDAYGHSAVISADGQTVLVGIPQLGITTYPPGTCGPRVGCPPIIQHQGPGETAMYSSSSNNTGGLGPLELSGLLIAAFLTRRGVGRRLRG